MIRHNATLKARIEKLERRKTRRPFPRLILAVYGQPLECIIGYRNRGVVAMRAPGETLDALEARAWALGSAFILEALYRPENRPSAVAEPVSSAPIQIAPEDPFALAGIGRRASPAELLASGAVRLPTPERLI